MSIGTPREAQPRVRQGLPDGFQKGRVHAVAIDMDIEQLRANYGDPYNNAYLEIRRVLQRHGFAWQQGSVHFGGDSVVLRSAKERPFAERKTTLEANTVTAVTCVLAAIDLAHGLPWFAASVRDIRMLRIEELNDLMPAVQQAVDGQASASQ